MCTYGTRARASSDAAPFGDDGTKIETSRWGCGWGVRWPRTAWAPARTSPWLWTGFELRRLFPPDV